MAFSIWLTSAMTWYFIPCAWSGKVQRSWSSPGDRRLTAATKKPPLAGRATTQARRRPIDGRSDVFRRRTPTTVRLRPPTRKPLHRFPAPALPDRHDPRAGRLADLFSLLSHPGNRRPRRGMMVPRTCERSEESERRGRLDSDG